jgi:uncharacterized YccA/Bax inhibitor family protein
MRDLIKRLGKPRSWLVFTTTCIAGLLLGGLCLGLYFAGLHVAGWIGFVVVIVCWVVAAFSSLSFFVGQFSGRYRNLQGKSWSELPW